MTDAAEILESFTVDQLQARLDELERERRATMVLLRAVAARERREDPFVKAQTARASQ